MGIVLLYGLAAFLETGIGIWIFGQVFPKREKMEKRHRFSEWMVFLGIILCLYSFPNFFWGITNKKRYICSLIIIHTVILGIYLIFKKSNEQLRYQESNSVKILLFIGITICMACQLWDSYQSYTAAIFGNIWPVFFLWAFYRCSIVQAYLWEFFFETNLGMLKNIYITYAGVFYNRSFEDFFYWPRDHTIKEVLYLMVLYIILLVLNRYTPLKNIIAQILNQHKRILLLFTSIEWLLLLKIVKNGLGQVKKNNLTASLIIASICVFCMMILYIRAIIKAAAVEKSLLDMRNNIVERQYQEMKGAYERYRCIVHDEKHMLLYLKECLENRDIDHAKKVVSSYQTNLNESGRCKWTGIPTLDFILSIKEKRFDDFAIKLELDCQIDVIPIDEADFIVLFSNLLENAIEATEQCENSERRVKITLKSINYMFFM